MPSSNKVYLEGDKVKDSLHNTLKCVKKIGIYKIYVEPFMSIKNYHILNTETLELKYGGFNNLSCLINDLEEDFK